MYKLKWQKGKMARSKISCHFAFYSLDFTFRIYPFRHPRQSHILRVKKLSYFCIRKKEMKPKKLKHIDFTAIIEKSEDGWYVGQLEELQEVISQGKTIEEL